jgi:hypothetical protein
LSAFEKENFATRMAGLVIPSVGDNYRRHETLQRFMLANDSVTLAVEVPIWLGDNDIRTQAPKQRGWVKIQSAKSTTPGQDSTGVDTAKEDPSGQLFPGLKRGGPDRKFNHYITKRIGTYFESIGITRDSVTLP